MIPNHFSPHVSGKDLNVLLSMLFLSFPFVQQTFA